jgi:putative phage-type endonuclease
MGSNPWKTPLQLYKEKISAENNIVMNEAMKRGTELEPIARELFCIKTGQKMIPKVLVKNWRMASLDGINAWNEVLEIKCPGAATHAIALEGKVPDYYYPQLQHQLYVSGGELVYYFSFDGIDGVIVEVARNDDYIDKMLIEEWKFYQCLVNKTPPEPAEGDYIQRDDALWNDCASRWQYLTNSIKELEKEEEEIRKQLIFLAGESNTKGGGISLCQVSRKGNVEYTRVPELKGVDVEKYRKEEIKTWRIMSSRSDGGDIH